MAKKCSIKAIDKNTGQVVDEVFPITTADSVLFSDNSNLQEMYENGDLTKVVIDTELLETSENPVQNKVIKAEFDKLKSVAKSGSYNDLTDKPTIPTKTSDLSNDSGFITIDDIGEQTQVTKTSELENDSGFITQDDVPTKTSQLENDSNFLTSYEETDPTVPNWAKQPNKPIYNYNEIDDTPIIPSKTSELTNDSNFVNEIKLQENYYDKSTIDNKLANIDTSGGSSGGSSGGGVTSYNDLTDKPFEVLGVKETELLPSTEFEFTVYEDDGSADALLALNPTVIPIVGNTYKIVFDGVSYECIAKDMSEMAGYTLIIFGNLGLQEGGGFENTGEPFIIGYMVQSGQSYLMCMTNDTSATHTIGISVIEEDIKYLESKFIKDMYYSEDGGMETLLPHTQATFNEQDGNYMTVMEVSFKFTVGKTYKVIYDNILYECIGTLIEGTVVVLGNVSILEGSFEDTGEPFLMYALEEEGTVGLLCFANDTATTHTLEILTDSEIVHQIPSKYINGYTKEEVDDLASQILANFYSKTEIDTMFGTYVDEVNTLLGGE